MESIHVDRLDHLGKLASVIKDVGLMSMVDARLVPDAQEEITAGEAIAGMILHGLGFANRPMSLTSQFYANTTLDLLVHEGVRAEMFNRFKVGRTLDEVHAYGFDLLFNELAVAVCAQEGIDLRFNHLHTTSFSLTGEYVPEADEHAITITHGYSKDHRPDVTQAVLELIVSQDGGVPFVSKSWDGHTSDTPVFQERAAALIATFQRSLAPRYLVADAKLYHQDHAAHLSQLGFITRIPHTLKVFSPVMTQALQWDMWQWLDETTRYQHLELCYYRMAQRWLVVSSQAALAALAKPWPYHHVESYHLIEHPHDARRPTSTTPMTLIDWQIHVQVRPDQEQIEHRTQHNSCFVLNRTTRHWYTPIAETRI